MNIPWDGARLFLAVAEAGSLSEAGRRLGITQPTASRRLAELEALLGSAVFTRRADGMKLTAFGERLLPPARRMAEWAGELDRAADGRGGAPRGIVRVTAPPGIAADFLAPFAAWAKAKLPAVRLEVISTVRTLDLARREADLAIRVGPPVRDELVTLASLQCDMGAFASRAYAARLPRRCRPADVDWICWAPPFEHLPSSVVLSRLVPGFQPAFASDEFLVQLKAAEAGLGAILLGRLRHRFTQAGALVEIPVELGQGITSRTQLLCARSALDIPRVRAVAELLVREFDEMTTDLRRPARHGATKPEPRS